MIHEKSNFPKPGDMRKAVYDADNDGVVDRARNADSAGDSQTVNGHTVESDVPENAVFTDTTYTIDSTPTADSANLVTSGGVAAALNQKQGLLNFDFVPAENSANPVTSSGIAAALNQKQDAIALDTEPTEGSTNMVTSGAILVALNQKQDTLTFDAVPTENSANPVTSGGVQTALSAKQDKIQSSSIIKVYLNGTELDIAAALNAVVALISSPDPTASFTCDRPVNEPDPVVPEDPAQSENGGDSNG